MKAVRYKTSLENIPADFFADPDGEWTYESLAEISGWSVSEGVAVGALTAPYRGHPEGSAVVTLNAKDRPYVVIVECSSDAELCVA